MEIAKRKRKRLAAKGYDLSFAAEVQPKGHITFKERDWYWHSGDGYHATLFVEGYPQSGLADFWGGEIMQIPGTRSFMHVTTLDNGDVQERISKSVSEKRSRLDGTQKATKDQAEIDEMQALMEWEQEIRMNNISAKGIWTRIYVSASTESELAERIEDIKNEVARFDLTLYLGEQELEYHAPYIPPSRLKDMPNSRKPQPLPVYALGGAFWNNFTKIQDPHGVYFGITPTDGVVDFDLLHQDKIRTRPFMLISGAPKMEQKKFFLKNADSLYGRGNKLYNIDLDGTFCSSASDKSEDRIIKLTERQHGLVIDMSGSNPDNRINIMQVLPTVTMDNGIDVDEISSFYMHVEKLKSFAQILNPDISNEDVNILEKLITAFYISNGYWKDNPELHRDEIHITSIVQDQYPLLSDFISYLYLQQNAYETRGRIQEARSIRRLHGVFDRLKTSYPIFDAHTNFINLDKEQVVTFDLSKLVGNATLLNLQLSQVLGIIQMYVVNNGKTQQRLRNQQFYSSIDQYKHCIVNISSANEILDPRFSQSVQYLSDMISRIGDNFGAVVLEMTSLQNILINNNSTELDGYSMAIRRIFSLMQYRVFANTDESTTSLIADTLRGSLTESELSTLPRLTKGFLFMNIAGAQNVVFEQFFMDGEFERYSYVE